MRKVTLFGMAAALLASFSCSQIVGITDTEVTAGSGGSAGSAGSADPGTGGMSTGGKSATTAGQSNDGGKAGNAATGGSTDGGTSSGGTSGGVPSDGGVPAGGTEGGVPAGGAGGSTGGTGGSQGGGGTGGGGAPPVLHGPKLISVGSYSIDATEVTVKQYKEFLTAKGGDTSGQPPVCTWNTSYYEQTAGVPSQPEDWPISYVDWCDAKAYCAWAGKQLCGATAGGAVAPADALKAGKSRWFQACGGPNGLPHPNTDWDCNNKGGFTDLAPVASFPGCEGFYAGLFDLQGNVWEWIDSCDGSTGKTDICLSLGTSEIQSFGYCDALNDESMRDATSHYIGFRCCSN